MADKFKLTDQEKASSTCQAQLDMFERLAQFVNDRLLEIESLETKVENLENTNPNTND
jgi:hypothetical protein|tara:strand:+ start:125 stop:298 length:174 start_codon:yes stop_codon:yes gene_type:complete